MNQERKEILATLAHQFILNRRLLPHYRSLIWNITTGSGEIEKKLIRMLHDGEEYQVTSTQSIQRRGDKIFTRYVA